MRISVCKFRRKSVGFVEVIVYFDVIRIREKLVWCVRNKVRCYNVINDSYRQLSNNYQLVSEGTASGHA